MDKTSLSDWDPEQLRELLSVAEEPEARGSGEEAAASGPSQSSVTAPQTLGTWIDRYQLTECLGEGGMAIVYLAEQQHPVQRKVALKLIKPGMGSKEVIARFEMERQTLTLLSHPNIAQIHDAGTTGSGAPYFVMEYVDGLPITEYCDRQQLSIEDRLNLFLQVCHALQHAHQKGIIHRDIKPSNILISFQDDQALPKIIDFGIAKAVSQPLAERTLLTENSQLLGTPEYMSPEQADMASEDIDTRSDVYSLGVLLYVLLTGVLPFDSEILRTGGIKGIRQMIREIDPKTPSTRLTKLGDEARTVAENRRTEMAALAKCLHKELEWIPLKAMRKERSERYRSASELADDIENYLKSDPLIAGPPSTVYRLKKFVRRNRSLVTGIAVLLAVLVAGVVVSTVLAIGQAHARTEAQVVADFLRNDLLASVDPDRGKGRDVTVRSFLDTASESLKGKFTNQPLVEASIRDTIGWTYRNLGDLEAAEPHLERAVELRQEHLGAEHPDTLDSVGRLAWLRCSQAQYEEAAELLEKAMSTCGRSLGEEDARMLDFANTLGCVYHDLGRCDESEQLYLKTIPVALRVLGEKHDTTLFMVGNLGQTYERQGRYDEAERRYLETLRLRDGFWDDENVWTLLYRSFLARVYTKQKRYRQAERLYLEILPIQCRVLGDEHSHTLWSVSGLARVYTHLGEYDEAEKLFDEALGGLQRVQGPEHRDTIRCMNGLAELYTAQSRFDKAKSMLMNALESSRRKLGDDHPWTLTSMNGLAVVYKEQARYDEAEKLLFETLEGRRLKLGDTHPHTRESLNNLIELYEAWNKPEEAEEWRAKLPQTEGVEQ